MRLAANKQAITHQAFALKAEPFRELDGGESQ
jgi:hypothetical protein